MQDSPTRCYLPLAISNRTITPMPRTISFLDPPKIPVTPHYETLSISRIDLLLQMLIKLLISPNYVSLPYDISFDFKTVPSYMTPFAKTRRIKHIPTKRKKRHHTRRHKRTRRHKNIRKRRKTIKGGGLFDFIMGRTIDAAVMSGMQKCPEGKLRVSSRDGRCGVFRSPGGCCIDKVIDVAGVKISRGHHQVPKLWSWSNWFRWPSWLSW